MSGSGERKKLSRTSSFKKRLSSASLAKLFKKKSSDASDFGSDDAKNKNHILSRMNSFGKRQRDDDGSDYGGDGAEKEEETVKNNDSNNNNSHDKKRRRRHHHHHHHKDNDDGSSSSSNSYSSSLSDEEEQKRKAKEHEEFLKREEELDNALPAELRKYRPQGFSLNMPPKDRPIRIYADGVFDLFHLGHMKQLEQCKKSFPNVTLICGIPDDKITHSLKGLTVLTDKQRCETLLHCKWVDEVIPDAPWCVTPEFLEEHKIDYVAHDDIPYVSADSDDIYKPIKEMGKFLTTQRTNGISTSDIITKIIRDYDKYLMRNFARGATRQELNVSWLKKNELEFKKHITDFRSYFKKNQKMLNNSSRDLYFEVRELMLKKTLGNNLYSKLVGYNNNNDSNNNKDFGDLKNVAHKHRRLIRDQSPASEFATEFTGEVPSSIHSGDDGDNDGDEDDSENSEDDGNESAKSNED